MTDPTLASPPNETPISPISRTTTLPHQDSLAVAIHASSIDTSVPAINAQPVELDGIPTSPEEQELKHRMNSWTDDKNADAELLRVEDKDMQQLEKEKRAAVLSSRSKDPGVIFDVPNGPTAEEVEAVNSKGRSGLEAKT